MKETIFFVHGMCVTGESWSFFKKFFEEKGYNCIAINLRHHHHGNRFDSDLGQTSLLDYASDLQQEIEGLRLEKPPIIIGHSMGGLLTQIIASRIPVKAQVLLAPAPPRSVIPAKWSLVWSFREVILQWGFWKKQFKFSESAADYGIFNNINKDEREALYDELVFESGRAVFEIGFWFLNFTKATAVDFSKIKAKTLFLSGVYDKIVPASLVKATSRKYHNADYKECPNGHMLQLENNKEEIADYIFNWLNS